MVRLPDEIIRQLRQPELVLRVGDVFHVSHLYLGTADGKDRFCLISGLERDKSGKIARVYVVLGSSGGRVEPRTFVVEPGEVGTPDRTYFRTPWYRWLDPAVVMSCGWRGRVADDRMPDLLAAIEASNVSVLRRLNA